MPGFLDVCRFNPALGGTTDWTYSTVVQGYQSPSAAGAVNGTVYRYRAESADLSQWEIGYGAYNSATGVFARSVVLFNSSGTTAKINFSSVPQVAIVAVAEDLTAIVLRSYLAGLTLSTAGSSATFSVAAGVAADSTNADMMTLSGSISKTTSSWTAGAGSGALDTGAIANNTWYHAYLIKRTDTQIVDVLISLSASAPALSANYTLARRIGSMKTDGSAHWLAFTQYGDNFIWSVAINEISTSSPSTSLTSVTLGGVPPGIATIVHIRGIFTSATAGNEVLMAAGDETSTLDGTSSGRNRTAEVATASIASVFQIDLQTNASAQVKYQSTTTSATLDFNTFGWIDRRGRDA